ncbi:hypothetical protein EDB80DRAFT_679506 [Ilyonectria destructans]|nr:hypothetical protein EDB80DRAFT_679506 [Ilyonectria destructans]
MAGLCSRTLWAWSGREQDDDPIFPLKVIRRLTHARRSNTTTTNFHQLPGTAHRLLPTNRAPSSPEAATRDAAASGPLGNGFWATACRCRTRRTRLTPSRPSNASRPVPCPHIVICACASLAVLASPAPFGSGHSLGAEAPALQYISPQALVQHASRPSPNPQHAGHRQPAPQRRLQPKPGPEKPPTTQTNLATDETQTEPKGHRHGSAPATDSITCRRCRILLALASSFRVNPLGPSSSTQCPVTSLPALIMLQAIPSRFNSLACRSSNILQSFAHVFTSLPAQLLPHTVFKPKRVSHGVVADLGPSFE